MMNVFEFISQAMHPNTMRELAFYKLELEIYKSKHPRITLTAVEKYRLLEQGLPLGGQLKKIIHVAHYSTFRRWAIGKPGKIDHDRRGRPRTIRGEMESLIMRMARENPLWGFARIRAELQKLFDSIPSRNTVKAVLKRNGLPSSPGRNLDSWDSRMKRTFETLWACDFFTKNVWTMLGPKVFYVLFFINIRTKVVHIAGITQHPNKAWVAERARQLSFLSNGEGKKLLVRDGDKKYTKEFNEIIKSYGIKTKVTPYRSPNLNPYAESWVSVIKRECLDHFVVFSLRHLEFLVQEFVKFYNTVRPHSALSHRPLTEILLKLSGDVRCESRLGGLLNHYFRE